MTLKVGIIHPFFDIMGGAEQTTISLIDALKKTEHLTTLYTVEPSSISETQNFKIHKIVKQKFSPLWKYQRMKEVKRLYKDSQNEDVLVIMGGGFMLQETKVSKVILYCHSTFEGEEEFLCKKFSGIKKIYYKIIQNNLKDGFTYMKNQKVKLIANSEYTKREIQKRFGKNSVVIYPPVDLDRFSKWFDVPKKSRVITISRFSPEKNLEFAVDIIKKSGLTYELVGNAIYESQIDLYNNLKSIVDQENISLHCNLPPLETENLLGSSKIYFHTSKETFGISVIESISAGCIPIVPNNSAFVETVPFDSLRFDNKEDAIMKLQDAISNKYDYLREELRDYIKKFCKKSFQENMLREIQN